MQELASKTKFRLWVIFIIIYGMSFILFTRLFYLQLIMGEEYIQKATENRRHLMKIQASRSVIFDRNGVNKLAYNRKSMTIMLVPANLPEDKLKRNKILSNLSILLDMSIDTITNTIREQSIDKHTPVVLKYDLDNKTLTKFYENNHLYGEGVYCENRPRRIYPYREKAAQLIGYTGIISKAELESYKTNTEYRSGSIVGKMGVEKYYDSVIRGKEGIMEREVDVLGNVISENLTKEPTPGDELILCIDADMQELAYDLMGDDKMGAVVVSRPATGEILALVSKPAFDPNIFTDRFSVDEFYMLQQNVDKPFLNRAIQGIYPPSSIFKLASAAALLSVGVDPRKTAFCAGGMKVGNRYFKCWATHKTQNMFDAIVNSCDVYFYTYGIIAGRDPIVKFAKDFGLANRTGIDIPGEMFGLVPELDWFFKMHKRNWSVGDTANISIGQGDLLATPIGINMMTMALANHGIVYKPYVLKEVRSISSKETLFTKEPELVRKIDLAKEYFDYINSAMHAVATYGTGGIIRAYTDIPAAAKTGTGEAGEGKKDHAWFTAFAPYGSDRIEDYIAVTVVIEHGGWGSAVAGPIAAQLLAYWFRNKSSYRKP